MSYFDCIILTPSRNRIGLLAKRIELLVEAAKLANITVCHLVFDDCSDEEYDYAGVLQELNEKYSPLYQVVHHYIPIRHGRRHFGPLYTKMFQAARGFQFKYVLIAMDDTIPCKDFFNRIIAHFRFRRYDDISVVGMNLGWRVSKMWRYSRYMDCGMLCTREALQALKWACPGVSERWLHAPGRSSGVGFMISRAFMRHPKYNLAENDGHSFMSVMGSDEPSQMFDGNPIKGQPTKAREALFVDSPGHVYDIVIDGKPIIKVEIPVLRLEPPPPPPIKLTVIMPMFRAKYIGWLPFESLVLQKGIDFKWELLIAEEVSEEPFGAKLIEAYRQRLFNVGCINLRYIGIQKWIPLAKKWIMLAKMAAETSEILCGQPADYYASPNKLARHMEVFSDPTIVWHQPRKAIHYLIKTGDAVLQDATNTKRKDNVMGKAMRPQFLRGAPDDPLQRTGVDGWIIKRYKAGLKAVGVPFKTMPDFNDDYKGALSTVGFNNISPKGRLPRVGKGLIFTKYTEDLRQYIPPFVMDKLEASRKFLPKHARSLPQNRQQ